MRNELFKYRKRKKVSLDGSVPGVPHSSFGRSRKHVSGMPYMPGSAGYNHSSYTGSMHREYHPRLNSPGVDWTEYNSHESSHISFARTPPIRTGPSHNFNRNASEMDGMLSIPTDDLPLDELWLMATGKSPKPQERPIGMSADEFAFVNGEVRTNINLHDDLNIRPLPGLSEITDTLGQLEKVLPQDHPDIINLTNAADKLTGGQFSADRQVSQATEPLSAVEDSDITDPHEEAEQFFNQQMQILDKSFDLPVSESAEVQEMPLREETALDTGTFESAEPFTNHSIEGIVRQDEQFLQTDQMMPMAELAPEPDAVPQEMPVDSTLEQAVENDAAAFGPQQQFVAEDMMPVADMPGPQMADPMEQDIGYGTAPVIDEINQAIDQAVEPDPFQPQYDPFMAPEYMFDPRYIPGYMMQGPMPFGPEMGPGQMMPMMPGPMPGP